MRSVTYLPSHLPTTPLPAVYPASPTETMAAPEPPGREEAWSRIARATGWAAEALASRAAARRTTSASPLGPPALQATPTTLGQPCVTVPVLSTTRVSTFEDRSRIGQN